MPEITVSPFALCPQLQDLFGKSPLAEGSPEWFQSIADTALDPGEEAVLAVARDDDGVPRAALPLVVTPGNGLRALTAPYTTIFAPALPEPSWARLLGAGARDYVAGSLRLDALDMGDPGLAAYAEGLSSSGLVSAGYVHFANRYESVPNFRDYWQSRPSRLQSTIRRKLALAAKSANVAFALFQDPGQMANAVAAYEEVYRASWKRPEPHPRFISAMVAALGGAGTVRLGTMTLGGDPVAAQIWLVKEGKATIFKLAHKEAAADYSPGSLLTHWMLSRLCQEEQIVEVDFGRGDDPYKRDWLTGARPRLGLIAGNPASVAGLKAIALRIWPTRLSNRLKNNTK